MNQQALEEAIVAYAKSCGGLCYPKALRAALTAYAEASGERVILENNSEASVTIQNYSLRGDVLQPGEELVVRKVGT